MNDEREGVNIRHLLGLKDEKALTFVVWDDDHDELRTEGDGFVQLLDVGTRPVVGDLHHLRTAKDHSKAGGNFLQRVDELRGGGLILGGVDEAPLIKFDDRPLLPVSEGAAPIRIFSFVFEGGAPLSQDGLRIQQPCTELDKLVIELQIPIFKELLCLRIFLDPFGESLQRFDPRLRVLPRVRPHVLHEVEVLPLLVGEPRHVAELGDQDGGALSRPHFPLGWQTGHQGLFWVDISTV